MEAELAIEGDSIYTRIDVILSEYGILRATYHGGNLTGVCTIKLMGFAEEIMNKVASAMFECKSEQCTMSKDEIGTTCNNVSTLLTLCDGALSGLCTKYPIGAVW